MRAESLMRDEALRIATGTDRRFDWSGGRVYRELWDERATFMRDLAAEMKSTSRPLSPIRTAPLQRR